MHLAQINIARVRYPLDDPRMAEFVGNLDRVNAVAERSEGFVWRLKDDTGNATQIEAYDDPRIIINMSVWESVEALEAFVYRTVHRRFVARRKEWFEPFDGPFMALWWVAPGELPDPIEGKLRLSQLSRFGPTAWAFTFARRFPASAAALPLATVDPHQGDEEPYRSCG